MISCDFRPIFGFRTIPRGLYMTLLLLARHQRPRGILGGCQAVADGRAVAVEEITGALVLEAWRAAGSAGLKRNRWFHLDLCLEMSRFLPKEPVADRFKRSAHGACLERKRFTLASKSGGSGSELFTCARWFEKLKRFEARTWHLPNS